MNSVGDRNFTVDIRALTICDLLNEAGQVVPIRSLWEQQPVILIFLRHFACDACRLHALEVWENRALYEAKGAKIHFIGNGAAHFIHSFKQQYNLDGASFFTDPTLKTFKAAGFRKGFWINAGEMMSRSKFLVAAVRQELRRTGEGNVWQLGGVLAVKPGGKVTYQYTSQMIGDFPPSSDVPKMSS